MKRELAFALNSYSQLTASLGRTRSSKPRPDGDFDDVSRSQSSGKRRKGSKWTGSEPDGDIDGPINQNLAKENGISAATGSEKPTSNGVVCEAQTVVDEAVKGVAEVPGESTQSTLVPLTESMPLNYLDQVVASNSGASDDGMNQTGPVVEMNGTNGASVLTPTKKLEMKMSKKIALSKVPKMVKELFATGLLEGYPVFYNSGTQGPPVRGLIKDEGILCLCSSCRGSQVFNPCQFEIHACNSYRRSAQYICLENGTSLLDVVKACKQSRLDSLEETIHQVAGPLPIKESIICLNCKGSFVSTTAEKLEQQCKRGVSTTDSNDRSLQLVSPLRRSGRNASETNSSQDISDENISSQDITEDKIAENSVPKSSLGLRRSSRNAIGGISSPDGNQGKISKDRSSISSLLPITPKSSSVHVSSQGRTELKIQRSSKLDSTPEFSGSISELILQENKSQKIIPVSSKGVLGSRAPKSPSVSTVSLSSQHKGKWKITRKDQRLHRLVFEDGGLPDGTEVAYYSDGQKLLEGYKEGAGIFCRCCDSVVTASGFEAHAGRASRRKPYNYIYTSNGVSLHEFAVSLLKTRNCSAKDNDDLCSICADGGNLLLCDGCPRAFHKECASLSSVPRGKWYCQYCQNMFVRERFVECNANAVAAGRVSGVDLIEQITQRCIRIVKTREDVEIIACVLCRGYDFRKSGFGPRTVIVCDQCEKEYHVGCLKEHNMADLEELPEGKWFCCNDCRSIFSDMQNLLSRGEEEIHDSLLSVIKQKHEEKRLDTVIQFEVKWRVLNGKIASPENRLLLSKAVSIFHESFDPIIDSATGLDYIPSMVYGRNISGQDFAGMYCAVLTVNSSIVSAGLFRVLGQAIAELPLVATSNCHQGKGYFQLLFSCIEKLLACLNVKTLVLPAAPEAESIWTDKFGFEKIDQEKLSDYRKTCWQMLTFQGTCMLQKAVPSLSVIQGEVIDAELRE